MSVAGSARAASPPANCSHTSAGADGHTCGHGTGGPFASRVAVPYPHQGSALDIQNVDPTHTLYTLLLSEASESGQWVASYKPNVAGTYAFYLDLPDRATFEEQPYPLELRDAFGEAVPVRLEHAVTSCPGYLSWVKVYELAASRYHLLLGGAPGDNVNVAVEHLEGFPQKLYIDADGDGYGTGGPLSSWCGAATGYSILEGDCNDDEPLVFPNSEGVCEALEGPCGSARTGGCASGDGGEGGVGSVASGGEPSGAGGAQGGTAGMGGEADLGPGDPQGGVNGDGGRDGSAGAKAEPGRLAPGTSDESSGCSCHVGRAPLSGGAAWFLVALGTQLVRRRTRFR